MHAREAGEDSHSGDDGAKHGVFRNRLGNKQHIGQTQSAFLFCSSRCLGAGWGGEGSRRCVQQTNKQTKFIGESTTHRNEESASGDELPAIDA